jgi:hypothetical protein
MKVTIHAVICIAIIIFHTGQINYILFQSGLSHLFHKGFGSCPDDLSLAKRLIWCEFNNFSEDDWDVHLV